jgi:dTDP-4-amino-4,6-dideoxygalactose transaminase
VSGQDYRIPLVNLKRQYDGLRDEVTAAMSEVLESKEFILGPFVSRFESHFATYHEVAHAVGCSSGTSAISLALEGLGVHAGDEVITVGHTFAASAGAIRNVGAVPVFVDIEPEAYGMDPRAIEAAISPRTRAIVPVHIYGTPCDMFAIAEIARRHELAVVEDAAQAHGATLQGRRVGGLGTAAAFSFYPRKNLGACGDAGAITTNDAALADRLRKLRDHGRISKYVHDIIGYNHRMDGIQAAVLTVKLKYLDQWNSHRRAAAHRYDAAFRVRGFKTIRPSATAMSVYHLYVVEVSNRDAVRIALARRGIATGTHYPVPLENQPAFKPWAPSAALTVTERVAERILSLPVCGDITEQEQDQVIEAFLDIART